MSEWLLFTIKWEIFQLIEFIIAWQEQAIFRKDDDGVRFVHDKHAELDFYSAHWNWNNSPYIDMSLHSDTLCRFQVTTFLLKLCLLKVAILDGGQGHLTILKIDHLRTIHTMFGLNWLTG